MPQQYNSSTLENNLLVRLNWGNSVARKKKDDAWLQLSAAMNRSLSGGVRKMYLNSEPDKVMKINAFS